MGWGLLLNRWVFTGLALAGMALTIYILHQNNENMRLKLDAAELRASQYKKTLVAYQDQFADQVHALNSERRFEIVRQENLLKTLNLIGDIDEDSNTPVNPAALRIIDGMYSPAR